MIKGTKIRAGLIGEKLGHSHSKTLHGFLRDYRYDLWPMPPEKLDAWMREGSFDGMNVTIPYKKAVIPYLSEVGETAQRIGAVNTIVRRADGSLYGDNTDFYGMSVMAARAGIQFAGRKTLILGSGGTSLTACDVVRQNGGEAIVISRSGENNYGNLDLHADADYLINTTPVGMYPNTDAQPVDLCRFPHLKGVLDVIYNPLRTRLLEQAKALGIPCEGGLSMLVYQAVRACEIFTGETVSAQEAQKAEKALRRSVTNLVLVGMPGCGKSTIGAMLADALGMSLVDLDEEVIRADGRSIPDIMA
ncbi:MAG: shikimate kinase, partial [Clostridia bacterium]|nr:shikimate kinase [Clostridia bacterium]